MLRERALKLLSIVAIKLIRSIFRLPNRFVAAILSGTLKAARAAGLPQDALSDINDARCAMRDGPPLSDSMRGIILKSDPELVADMIFNVLRGDPPIEEVDPW